MKREWFETDYYAVLGVKKDASQGEITKAYRQLARQFHPDTNPGDSAAEERFKEISTAYEVVGDDEKRASYDEARRLGSMGGGFGGSGGSGGPGFGFEGADIGDILGSMFGGGGSGSSATNPAADMPEFDAQDVTKKHNFRSLSMKLCGAQPPRFPLPILRVRDR